MTITASTIAMNTAGHDGGGIVNQSTLIVNTSTLSGNTVSSSTGRSYGGGLFNAAGGNATLNDSMITGNTATVTTTVGVGLYSQGGGICNGGYYAAAPAQSPTLTLNRSTISGNHATGGTFRSAGGIYNDNFGALTATSCTISGNDATGANGFFGSTGGGVDNRNTATLINSTIANNTISGAGADSGGAGISTADNLTLTNCTITGNQDMTASGGGGLLVVSGTATVRNTIIAGNTTTTPANGPDVQGIVSWPTSA